VQDSISATTTRRSNCDRCTSPFSHRNREVHVTARINQKRNSNEICRTA